MPNTIEQDYFFFSLVQCKHCVNSMAKIRIYRRCGTAKAQLKHMNPEKSFNLGKSIKY